MKLVISMVVVSLVLAMALPAVAEDTAALYKAKCQVCHGPDGAGSVAGKKMGAHDFKDPEVVKATDAELFKATKEGKGKMAKFDGKLTDDQLKDLIKYVRSLQKK